MGQVIVRRMEFVISLHSGEVLLPQKKSMSHMPQFLSIISNNRKEKNPGWI